MGSARRGECLRGLMAALVSKMIPRTVEEECCGGKKTFDAFMIQKAVDESRIIIRGVRNRKLVLKLKADFSMGQGESEAIALALQEKARLVGVDDKCGINACKLTGVSFHHGSGYFVAKPAEGPDRQRRCAESSLVARQTRTLQEFNSGRCEAKAGGTIMTKTMSIRMDRDNYEFLNAISREERSDLSKAVRDLVTRGRVLLAVEKYRKGEASLGKAAQVAGLPVGQMMTLLGEFAVRAKIDQANYRQSLENLAKVW
ncbi:MAG: hypothetical protein QOH35_2627 [Acidobacteriaceae bacterium]|nr:hypothetical protein [Acidobacteriaceae bacterium]